jgi:hypothetical protein
MFVLSCTQLPVQLEPAIALPVLLLIFKHLRTPSSDSKSIHPIQSAIVALTGIGRLGGNLRSTAQHSTAQHSTAQHSTAQHSTAWHSTAWQGQLSYSASTLLCKQALAALGGNLHRALHNTPSSVSYATKATN